MALSSPQATVGGRSILLGCFLCWAVQDFQDWRSEGRRPGERSENPPWDLPPHGGTEGPPPPANHGG